MKEWHEFANDGRLVAAIWMLDTRSSELNQLQSLESLSLEAYRDWKRPLDQLLDFLQRLVFAVHEGELETAAVSEAAGWYFERVREIDAVKEYCEGNGYEAVLDFDPDSE